MRIFSLPISKQIATVALICALCSGVAGVGWAVDSESESPQPPDLAGIVMAVTPDGFMLVSPSGGQEDDIVKVRQWGVEIDPLALELAALGRKVECKIIYETGEYLGTECDILYFIDNSITASQVRPPSVSKWPYEGIRFFPLSHGIGINKCSKDDFAHFPEFPKLVIKDVMINYYKYHCELYGSADQ